MKEIILDASVYDKKSVKVVEIMGRNAGWLTGAAALAVSDSKNYCCFIKSFIFFGSTNLSVIAAIAVSRLRSLASKVSAFISIASVGDPDI